MKKATTIHMGRDRGITWCGAEMKVGSTSWIPVPGVCKTCLKIYNSIRRGHSLPALDENNKEVAR